MWSIARIKDLGKVITGSTPPTIDPANFGSGYHFIKPPDLHEDRRKVFETEMEMSEIGARTQYSRLLPANTPCVVCIGTIGKLGLTTRPSFTNQQINSVIVDQTRHDPIFTYYLLRHTIPKVKQLNAGSASGRENVNKSSFENIEVLVPSLPVQCRIAAILSAYDELIENSQRRIRILEAMARTLYREWFVHFRFPGHENHPRVASPLGEIPEGWEVKSIESLLVDHIGGGWGKDMPDKIHTEPAGVIRGTDIPAARNSQVVSVPHRYHAPSNLRSRKLMAGDIVFEVSGGSKGQPVGRTLLITPELLSAFDGDVICASFCKRIRPDAYGYGAELLYLSFLEGYESGEIEQFQVQSTGISNFKWTEYLAKTERNVPPTALRSRFREQVAPLFTQIATLGLQAQNLRGTRDLLLPRLLSGQVEVEAA